MTRVVNVLPRQRFVSTDQGGDQLFLMDSELIDTLGAADEVTLEVTVYATSATGTATVTVFAGNNTKIRPSSALGGSQLSSTAVSLGVNNLASVGHPHKGRLDLTVTAGDSVDTNSQWVELEVNASLVFL